MTTPQTSPDWEIVSVPRAWHDAHPPAARPRLKLFWDVFTISLLVIILLCALVTGFTVLGGMLFPGPGPTILALGLGVVFAAVVWFIVSHTLLYRGTPVLLALAAILWGVTGGVVLGGFTSSEHLSELAVGWGTPQIAWSLAGAWPEETAKALGVVLLLFAGRTWWNRPWHGLVAGVLVGVGFEAFENALYAISLAPTHAVSDVQGVLEMWLIRLVAGPLLHALCTGLVGYAIGVALLRADLTGVQRVSWVLGGWGAGFAVHALWNLMPDWERDSTTAGLIRMALVWVGGTTVLVTVWVHSHREARAAADAGMYPVVTVYRKRPVAGTPMTGLPGLPGYPQYPGYPPATRLPGYPGMPAQQFPQPPRQWPQHPPRWPDPPQR